MTATTEISLALRLSEEINKQLAPDITKAISERPAVFFDGEDPAPGFFEKMLDDYNYIRANAFSEVFKRDLGPETCEEYEDVIDKADDVVRTTILNSDAHNSKFLIDYLDALHERSIIIHGCAVSNLTRSPFTAMDSIRESFSSRVPVAEALKAVRILQAKEIWEDVCRVALNDDDEIQEPFMHFAEGTDITDVAHWLSDDFNYNEAIDLVDDILKRPKTSSMSMN